jgi:tetratricopeptide (TPR) repeat protein
MDKAASALQDGVGFVKQAVELDKNKKFDEAVKYYDLAVYFLKIACNEKDQSDPSLEALRKKIIEYKTRSKTLKIQLAPAKATSDKALKEKETVQLTIGQELQRALDLAERAKQHDKNKEFAPAFELYKEALEYFMSAAKREECEQVKMMLNKSIKMYIEHAEKIKKFLVAMNQYTPYQSRKAEGSQDPSLSVSRVAVKEFGVNDIDMRIGSLRCEQSATFWNDAHALQMIGKRRSTR